MTKHPAIIYFIRHRGDLSAPIKIGGTTNLPLRLDTFACGNPLPLEVLAVTQSSLHQERDLHRRFAALKRWREWFEPTQDLLSYIADLATFMNRDVALEPLVTFVQAYNHGKPLRELPPPRMTAPTVLSTPVTGAVASLRPARDMDLFMARVRRSALRSIGARLR